MSEKEQFLDYLKNKEAHALKWGAKKGVPAGVRKSWILQASIFIEVREEFEQIFNIAK